MFLAAWMRGNAYKIIPDLRSLKHNSAIMSISAAIHPVRLTTHQSPRLGRVPTTCHGTKGLHSLHLLAVTVSAVCFAATWRPAHIHLCVCVCVSGAHMELFINKGIFFVQAFQSTEVKQWNKINNKKMKRGGWRSHFTEVNASHSSSFKSLSRSFSFPELCLALAPGHNLCR